MKSEQFFEYLPQYIEDIIEQFANNTHTNKENGISINNDANFQHKYIEITIPSTDDNLYYLQKILNDKLNKKEYVFSAKLHNNIPVLICDELDEFILPTNDQDIYKHIIKGENIIASLDDFDTEHLDTYIGIKVLVVYPIGE